MTDENFQIDKLRAMFREMKPELRAKVISELERSGLRGETMRGMEAVLSELRASVRGSGVKAERFANPTRLFFGAVDPFVIDASAEHAYPGRIARASLDPAWAWIGRDLIPDEANAYFERASAFLAAGDLANAEAAALALQDLVVLRFGQALAAVKDDMAHRRLAFQIGSARGLDDMGKIVAVLAARDALTAFAARLPHRTAVLVDDQLEATKALMDSSISTRPNCLPYLLALVMQRLQSPWQLVRLATLAAESDSPARVAATPYSIAIDIVMSEVEQQVRQLKRDLKGGQGKSVADLLRLIHDAVRGLRSDIDLSGDSAWSRQLAAIRGDAAGTLKPELDSIPGRVRRVLRARSPREAAQAAGISASEVTEIEELIDLLCACRNFAGELAVSEVTLRSHSELQHYLETSAQTLMEAARSSTGTDQKLRQSQFDASVRFCARLFGPGRAPAGVRVAAICAIAAGDGA
ncbi:MAG: hypothetical protein HY056_00310 [Proteobacteria bacterium]|nr:hypothetical protein [Pseudomonadota bacterium]